MLPFHTPSSDRYAEAIRLLPALPEYAPEHLCTEAFRLYADTQLEMFYAPFDTINHSAKLAIVGITPGFQQMEIAYRVARAALALGRDAESASREAKAHASFAGTMRRNLVSMLNDIGINNALEVPDSVVLFETAQTLLHTSSAIRYPVLVRGANYTGHTPQPLQHPVLRGMIFDVLAPELAAVPDALVIPLGKAVECCLAALVSAGSLSRDRCLLGFPHPSGGNGHRKREFERNRDALRMKATNWFEGKAGVAAV